MLLFSIAYLLLFLLLSFFAYPIFLILQGLSFKITRFDIDTVEAKHNFSIFLSNLLGVLFPIIIFFIVGIISTAKLMAQIVYGGLHRAPDWAITFLKNKFEILFVLLIITFLINIYLQRKKIVSVKQNISSTALTYIFYTITLYLMGEVILIGLSFIYKKLAELFFIILN